MEMSNVAAIRKFFSEGKNGSPVSMDELKQLSKEDREELGTFISLNIFLFGVTILRSCAKEYAILQSSMAVCRKELNVK